jgi:hypothetical protein
VNVIVPYVDLHPATRAALERDGVPAYYVDTSESPDAYYWVLNAAWRVGRAFIVLEQDKVPAPGVLRELWECDHHWCVASVPVRNGADPAGYPSLACVKFGRALIAAEPSLLDDVGEVDVGYGEREWSRLDLVLAGLLGGRGWEPHEHRVTVEHLHREAAA